jgi:serine/threonine protein kinase
MLADRGLYVAPDTAAEKPPRIIKLVRGSVTYFRIIGTIGTMFRARPLLVGAEGEIVIDLAEVDRFDATGQREWRRMLKTLSTQVAAVTVVDVTELFLSVAGDSLGLAKNLHVASVLVPSRCLECDRVSARSQTLIGADWPLRLAEEVCSTCGGASRTELGADILAPLRRVSTVPPPASAKLIAQRDEILSRELTDANVARAGENASAAVGAGDMILGKYKIVKRLSAGGMAEIFLANQTGIGGFEKPVALKRIQSKLLESRHLAIDMFLNEAKIAGRLTHPNIVQVLDVGEVGGALYLAMEYVRGKDLREVVKQLRARSARMPLAVACHVVREVAQALHHAYWSKDMAGKRLSVVHRDVSPHNVILGFDGSVKLLDFGVAMSAVTEETESMIVGKWMYMSPEHAQSQQLDHRSDLFSLGVILYLLCTSTTPFAGADPKEIVRKIRAGHFKPIQQAAPDTPEPLAMLVQKMLAANPDDRPQTGQEIASTMTEIARNHGLESSAPQISHFLSELFNDETTGITELVMTHYLDELDTRRLAVGSGPTQPQGGEESSPSPFSHSNSLGPGSGSESLKPKARVTPTDLASMDDASISISPRPVEIQASSSSLPIARPTQTKSGSGVGRVLLMLLIIAALAVGAFFLVRPTF